MKVKKGGVVISIPPIDLKRYREAGWKKVDERSKEFWHEVNERKKLKKLAKGGSEDDIKSN